MKNKVLIVCGGEISFELLTNYCKNSDIIIAVDHGYDYLKKIGYESSILIGDLDSVNNINKDIEILKFNPKKNYSDTELALNKAMEYKPYEINILGATGGRLDHFLANVDILIKNLNKVDTYIVDTKNRIRICEDKIYVLKKYKYFSILPYTYEVNGLSIKGAEYEIDNINIQRGRSFTISNSVVADKAEITLKSGVIILIESDDNEIYD